MKRNILLVDDNERSNLVVKRLLEEYYHVSVAENGFEALEALRVTVPDIILLDWNMPVMDGLSTLKALKADIILKHIPVIMITGQMTDNDNLLQAYNEGVVDFIRKPFDAMELLARVKSIIQLGEYYRDSVIQKEQEVFRSALQIMAQQEFIKNIQNLINEALKDPCRSELLKNLNTQLQSRLVKNAWEQVESSFVRVNPGFFKNLLEKHPDLTPAELKLAALLRLNMSSKDMSNLTNLSLEGIRVSRSRLKKKLSLSDQENLTSYLFYF